MTGERCDLLVDDGRILTMDAARTVHERGAIAVRAGTIVAVGDRDELRQRYDAERTIDASGAIVHPGFVDAHYHATIHATRDMLPDSGPPAGGNARSGASFGLFARWFEAIEGEDEHASALLACAEMARNGVTCFMDPGTTLEPDAVAEAVEAVGIRASLADPFLWDVEGGLTLASEIPRAPADRKRALGLLGGQLRRNDDPDALVRGHVAVYGSGSASEELERAASDCAAANGAVLTQHQNLDPADGAFDRDRFGRDGLVHLAEIGVLGEHCTFMHMNVLTDAERDAVVESGMSLSWHPGNFLFYGISRYGPSPAPGLHRRGTNVAIGSDVAKAWAFGDMGWLGYLVARMNGEPFGPDDVLTLNTVAGAKAVGMGSRIGSLEVGKRADLVIREREAPESWPGIQPEQNAALISRTRGVATVVVDGRVVVERGRLANADEEMIYAHARESAQRMMQRVGL